MANKNKGVCDHKPDRTGPCNCWTYWHISLDMGKTKEDGKPDIVHIIRYAPDIEDALTKAYKGIWYPVAVRLATPFEIEQRGNAFKL